MADHLVALQDEEQGQLLFEFLNSAYPPDKVPFSVMTKQDQPQTRAGSSDGEDQTIRITVSGVHGNPHTLHYSASPLQYSTAHPGERNATFQAARIAIDSAVEAWWDAEKNKQKAASKASTQL
jgi:hypothetical protein